MNADQTQSGPPTEELRRREAFVLELAVALHRAGASSQRLEGAVLDIADHLGLQAAQIFTTPTSIWCGFGDPESQRTLLTRVEPTESNMERLVLLDQLAGQVATGKVNIAEGRQAVKEITDRPLRYPLPMMPVVFGASSACVSLFFGGSWQDFAASAVVGLVVGALIVLSVRKARLARGIDFLAGFIAAALAGLISRFFDGVDALTVTIAGLIALVPGLTLTIAMGELAARHLVSGTARVMYALIIVLSIGVGVAIGRALVQGEPPTNAIAAPEWITYVALAVIPVVLAMLFQVRPSEWPAAAAAAWSGYFAASMGAEILGVELAASTGAFAVGLVANAHARIRRMPAAVAAIPGIMLLVPGSLGLRTFDALLTDDPLRGLDTAFTTLLTAAGLVAGLLLSNIVLPSRQPL
ncbi:MAG: threonine/serine exporter family protein [Planctomycetota bacterium]